MYVGMYALLTGRVQSLDTCIVMVDPTHGTIHSNAHLRCLCGHGPPLCNEPIHHPVQLLHGLVVLHVVGCWKPLWGDKGGRCTLGKEAKGRLDGCCVDRSVKRRVPARQQVSMHATAHM